MKHNKKGERKLNQKTSLHKTLFIIQLHAIQRQSDAKLPQHNYLGFGI